MDATAEDTIFHPFYNSDDGDVVLSVARTRRTRALTPLKQKIVKFRVHSLFLKTSSSVFRQMLEIPRTEKENASDPIALTESYDVLEFMLDAIYPNERIPTAKNWAMVWAIAVAADKYDMPRVVQALQQSVLVTKLHNDALEVYALGCHYKWKDIQRTALEDSLKNTISFTDPSTRETLEKLNRNDFLKLLSEQECSWRFITFQLHPDEQLLRQYETRIENVPYEVDSEDFLWTCNCGTKNLTEEVVHSFYDTLRYYVRGFLALNTAKRMDLTRAETWASSIFKFEEMRCEECGDALETAISIPEKILVFE